MTVYIVLLCYLLLIDAISRLLPEKKQRLFQAIGGGIGLWVVLSLRSVYCGVDLVQDDAQGARNYLWMFNDAQSRSFTELLFGYSERIEPGWMVLCKLLSFISDNFIVFLSLIAAIQIILIGFVLKKSSRDIIFSYIVYFCFGLYAFSFSGLRQSTAIAVTFFASYFLMKDKPKTFFILVLLAFTLHRSSLLFLIALFLRKVKFTKGRAVIISLAVLILLPFLGILTQFFSTALFSERYNVSAVMDSGGAYTMFAVYGLLVLLSFRFPNTPGNGFLRYMILASFAIQSLGVVSSSYLTRIGYYFQVFFLLYFPILVEAYFSKKARKPIMLLASFLFLAFFYLTTKNSPLNVIPYNYFWVISY